MKWKGYQSALAGSLLVASCVGVEIKSTGDFCDVARPHEYGSEAVADLIAEEDATLLERDAAHNLYGQKHCGWRFSE